MSWCLVGGCHLQSCHGYLCALLKACGSRLVAHPSPSSSVGDDFNYSRFKDFIMFLYVFMNIVKVFDAKNYG